MTYRCNGRRAVDPFRPFWDFVKMIGYEPCWIWAGWLDSDGYAQSAIEGSSVRMARWAYGVFREPVPADLVIDHLCRVRACVNPYHLEVVTPSINTQRAPCPSTLNRLKTHCKRGHLLAGENLLAYPATKGRRACRECALGYWQKYNAKRIPPR